MNPQFLNTRAEVKFWPAHNSLPHCSGACGQGRYACITPDLCNQMAEDARPPMSAKDAAWAVALVAGAWAVPVGLVAVIAAAVAWGAK